ncbi:MAG: tetratricopeptide repeat protein [Bacillota bacterium]
MKSIFIFSLITLITGSPLLALAIILIIYFFIDRRFIGLLPDFSAWWRRKRRIGDLKRTVGANPHNGDALLELGVSYYERKKFREAVDYFERAYGRMKDWPEVHFFLGASSYETGNTDKGLAEIREALDMSPKISHGFPYIYLIRAILEGKSDSKSESIPELENRLLRHGSVQAFYEAGKLLRRHGHKAEAQKFFREVLENYSLSSPTFRRNYRKMAIMSRYYDMGIRN